MDSSKELFETKLMPPDVLTIGASNRLVSVRAFANELRILPEEAHAFLNDLRIPITNLRRQDKADEKGFINLWCLDRNLFCQGTRGVGYEALHALEQEILLKEMEVARAIYRKAGTQAVLDRLALISKKLREAVRQSIEREKPRPGPKPKKKNNRRPW